MVTRLVVLRCVTSETACLFVMLVRAVILLKA